MQFLVVNAVMKMTDYPRAYSMRLAYTPGIDMRGWMLGIRLHHTKLVVFLHNMAAEVVLASVLSSA